MKKINTLIVLFSLSILVSSCSKDKKVAPLEGKWEITRSGILVNGNEFVFPYEHTPGCDKDFVEFIAVCIYRQHFFEIENTDCETFIESGVWSRSGNSIAIVIDGDLSLADIMVLTETSLKLKITYDDDDSFTYIAEYIRK